MENQISKVRLNIGIELYMPIEMVFYNSANANNLFFFSQCKCYRFVKTLKHNSTGKILTDTGAAASSIDRFQLQCIITVQSCLVSVMQQ